MLVDSIQAPLVRRTVQKNVLVPQRSTWRNGLVVVGLACMTVISARSSQALALIGKSQGANTSHTGHAVRQPSAIGNGLAAWYTMDGNAKDSSSKGNDGILVGTPSFGDGKYSKALQLNGTTDYVKVNSSPATNYTGSFAVSVWVKTNSLSNSQQTIIANTSDYVAGTGWLLFYEGPNNGHNVQFALDGYHATACGTYAPCFTRSLINDNKRHNIVGGWDGTNVTLYLDGVLQSTQGISSYPYASSSLPLYIGSYANTNNFHGSIDDMRIYNGHVLTQAEITQIYSGSQPANCDQTCMAWWKMDEQSGSNALDSTSRGNTGTVTSASFTSGVFGNAYKFTGTGSYVNAPSSSSLDVTGTGITIEGWVYPTSNGTYATIISKINTRRDQEPSATPGNGLA